MIGETDTIKSVNEKYLEIGELAPVMRRNNMIPKKGSEEKLSFYLGKYNLTSHLPVCIQMFASGSHLEARGLEQEK